MRKGLSGILFGFFVCVCMLLLPWKTMSAMAAETYDFYRDGSGKNITADDAVEATQPIAQERAAGMSLFAVTMSTSDDGINLLKQYEGCRLTAYKAVATETYYTIGYGHYGPDVTKDMTITQAQADALFKQDIVKYETYVNNFLNKYGLTITQRQFDALVSLTYNCGNIWVTYDTFVLKTYLINGIEKYSHLEVMNAFRSWKRSGGRIVTGLVHRRMQEAAYFLDDETMAVYCKGRYKVDNTTLNVRAGAGTNYDKIATLADGAEIEVTEINGYWGKYETGWVCLDYCTLNFARATISSVTSDETGVTVAWNEGSDAVKYLLKRKDQTGNIQQIAEVTTTRYTDTNVVSGEQYSYYVYSVKEDGTVDEDTSDTTGISILYIAQPALSSVKNTTTGIKVKWNASVGAEAYCVLRKKDNGSWKKLAVTKENSYIDTTAVSGTAYSYSVRCSDAAGKIYTSSFHKTGLSIVCLSQPAISGIENKATGIKVTWKAVTGAAGYYVYRKKNTGDWQKVKKTTSLSWTDKSASSNAVPYSYKIYAYCVDAANVQMKSGASAGRKIYRLKSPNISSLTPVKYQKVKVKCKKISKARGYQIEYSKKSTFASSKKIKVTAASATLSRLSWKKKYYVRVRAYMKVGSKTYYSAWSTKKSVKVTK